MDLTQPLDGHTKTALIRAFETHHVLVFPGCENLTDEQHVAFSRNFSQSLEQFPQSDMGVASLPEIYAVSNVGQDGKILDTQSDMVRFQSLTQTWHTDGEQPSCSPSR